MNEDQSSDVRKEIHAALATLNDLFVFSVGLLKFFLTDIRKRPSLRRLRLKKMKRGGI